MASTGSSREAVKAGTKPEITPIIAETVSPRMIFEEVRTSSKSMEAVTAVAPIKTMNSPKLPPSKQRITDSNKN